MASNTSINLATLDFDTIKSNLRTFMRSQDIFADYDFDGSNINMLLEVMAYNTHLNSFYTNMLASESFLDSAVLDSSVISHAKELNYLPRSARSAAATVVLTVEQAGQDFLVIPKGTPFSATVNSETFTFYTDETQIYYAAVNATSNTYTFTTDEISIYEGVYVSDTFITDYSQENQRFILSNKNIDTRSITVTSFEDSGSANVAYLQATTMLDLTGSSKKYFIQLSETGKYEIVFGDDVIGRRPKDGSVIVVQYRACAGERPNGATVFTIDRDITADNSGRITTETEQSAIGGSAQETTASIKYNAPRHFQTQERAITTTDCETLLQQQFPEINALSVYGGESVTPKQYGKVFIAIDIADVDGIPDSKKTEYYQFIKPKMAMPIEPVFVNPSYLYYTVKSTVKYNLNVTNLKSNEIRTLVTSSILGYNEDNLNDFNKTLRYSKLINEIDDAHTSIISNQTEVEIYKKILLDVGAPQNIDIDFNIHIHSSYPVLTAAHPSEDLHAIRSSYFVFNGDRVLLEDDGNGVIRIIKTVGDKDIKIKDVGTVDYHTGKIKLTNFIVDSYEGSYFKIYALPHDKDIVPYKSDIFTLETEEINITVEASRE